MIWLVFLTFFSFSAACLGASVEVLEVEKLFHVPEKASSFTVELQIDNPSAHLLVVEDVELDCSCGKYVLKDRQIKPNQATKLELQFSGVLGNSSVPEERHPVLIKLSENGASRLQKVNVILKRAPAIVLNPSKIVWERDQVSAKSVQVEGSKDRGQLTVEIEAGAEIIRWKKDEKEPSLIVIERPEGRGVLFAVLRITSEDGISQQSVLHLVME